MKIKKPYAKEKGKGVDCGESMTEQAHAKECDMNHILRQYQKTGLIKHAKENQGRYDDVTSQDFQEAMFLVTQAQNMFNELPANIRNRFGNDPAAFMDFVHDPSNQAEMARMGILAGNDGIDVTGAAVGSPVEPPKDLVEKNPEPQPAP
jgi:phage internal scaffolding protein